MERQKYLRPQEVAEYSLRYSINAKTNVFSDVNNSKPAADFELALSYDMMM